MRYWLGRLLQLVGLILLPVAIAGNLARPDELKESYTLQLAAVGVAVFYLGWLLQKGSRPG
jgi:hypothetical protein